MNMHRIARGSSLFVPIFLFALAGCDTISGSGHARTIEREVPSFTRIEVSAGLNVTLTEGPQSVRITGDDNVVPFVSTRVRNGVLVIEPEADFHLAVPLTIDVAAPVLEGASLRAGGELWITGIEAESFDLACDAGGEVSATGHVDHLDVRLTAGGEMDTVGLEASSVTVHNSAGGTAAITAQERIEGLVESGSVVLVHGDPDTQGVHTASGGSIEYVDD